MASTSAKFGFIKGSPIIDVAELPNPVTKSAINPTGTYDKVWFNTSLSYDEVINILKQLDLSEYNTYAVFVDSTNEDNALSVLDLSSTYNIPNLFALGFGETQVWMSNELAQAFGSGQGGWQEFENPFSLGGNITGVSELEGMSIGSQNELLKDLVYVEEVDESKINTKALYRLPDGTLWHYNGQWNAVGSGGVEEEGTAINPTGSYSKFYFNTKLSVNEVVAILSKLEYEIDSSYVAFVCNAETYPNVSFVAMNQGNLYAIVLNFNNDMVPIFISEDTDVTGDGNIIKAGWQDLSNTNGMFVDNYFDFIIELIGSGNLDEYVVGQQNELIKNLISVTPFDINAKIAVLTKRIDSLEARIKALEEA